MKVNDVSAFWTLCEGRGSLVPRLVKSDTSLIFKMLGELNTLHRIIMTGTPLNNNIRCVLSPLVRKFHLSNVDLI